MGWHGSTRLIHVANASAEFSPPLPPPAPPPLSSVLILKSELFNDCGNLSILKMFDAREMHQSRTSVRSERVSAVDSKFDKGKGKPIGDTSDDVFMLSKLSTKEGSHRVRVAQDLMRGLPETLAYFVSGECCCPG